MATGLVHLTESRVAELLNWPLVYEAVEQALSAITKRKANDQQPTSVQPPRSFTPSDNGEHIFGVNKQTNIS